MEKTCKTCINLCNKSGEVCNLYKGEVQEMLREIDKKLKEGNMIEVGEYVRTSRGIIGKLIRVEFDEIDKSLKWYVFLGKDEFGIEKEIYINKPYIKNHSKELIDLIEAGDYVNGKLIHTIRKGKNYCYLYYGNCKTFVDYQIKEILTKEQYEANCYKVKEE